MLKRSITAIQQWLSPVHNARNPRSAQAGEPCSARRGFFKKAAVGVVTVTGTAGLAKGVVDSFPQPGMKRRYQEDGRAGEQELMKREYVLMSDQEKAEMMQTFVDNYSDQS